MAKGDYENLTVEFKPGASPVAHFRAADESEIEKVNLKGDMGADEVLKLFAEHGFTPVIKKAEYSEKPMSTHDFGEAHYEVFNTLDRFEGAAEFAATRTDEKGRPGRLLTVASEAENRDLRKWLNSVRNVGGVWLGCTDEAEEGHWRWMSDDNALFYSNGGASDGHYTNWGNGEPNNAGGSEDCAIMSVAGTWVDDNCNNKHRVVIKYGPDDRSAASHDEL